MKQLTFQIITFKPLSKQTTCIQSLPKKIKTFLTQNSTQLFKELYKELDIIAIQPSRKNIDDLNQLSHALNKLKSHFPTIITKNIYSNINKQIQNIVTIYAIQTSEKIDILITHKRYRQAVDELMSLKKNNLLTSEKKILLSNIKNYLKRTLYINTIKVHDETINKLVSQSQENQKTLYNQKGTLLAEKNINIPKEFKRSFFHYIKKESSPYLSIALSTSANYRVDISVGYHKESDIVETRKEIEDFFQVKFDANGYWHQQPVIYELFTKKETYFISINANAYLQKSNKHIAHYTFETQVPVESYRIGNYINLNPNIVNMLESETYKTYLIPPVSR